MAVMCTYLVSLDYILCHTRQTAVISHLTRLSLVAASSKPYPFQVGHILQSPKVNFLIVRVKANS